MQTNPVLVKIHLKRAAEMDCSLPLPELQPSRRGFPYSLRGCVGGFAAGFGGTGEPGVVVGAVVGVGKG